MTPNRQKIYKAAHVVVLKRFAAGALRNEGWAAALARLLRAVTGEDFTPSRVEQWSRSTPTGIPLSAVEAVIAAGVAAGLDPPIELDNFFPRTLPEGLDED